MDTDGQPIHCGARPPPGNAPTFADVSTGQATPLKSYELEDVSDSAPFAYTIAGLKAGTEYRVRVSAYNDRGYNEPRLALPNKLAPLTASDLPTHTTLLVNTDSSLKVQWRHPLSDGGTDHQVQNRVGHEGLVRLQPERHGAGQAQCAFCRPRQTAR